jgi:hypothetical protein
MTEINEDGFTDEEVNSALKILGTLKERAMNNGEEHERADISQTAYYIRNYREQSEWRGERPCDRVDLSKNETLTGSVENSEDA